MSFARRALAACGLACAVAFALAGTAGAHTSVVSSAPELGASLSAPPERVVVSFASPPARVESGSVVVAGERLSGAPRLDPSDARRLIVPLDPGPAGEYRGRWRVTSPDGHEISGEIAFSADAPAPVWREVAALSSLLREVGAGVLAGAAAVGST